MTVGEDVELGALDPRGHGQPLGGRVESRRLGELQLSGAERGENHTGPVPVHRRRHQQAHDEEHAPEPHAAYPPAEREEPAGEAAWWMFLRCGECGMSREIAVSNADADRFEEAAGDLLNIRRRYPLAAFGYVFLVTANILDSPNQFVRQFLAGEAHGPLGMD